SKALLRLCGVWALTLVIFFATRARANLAESTWIFHGPSGDEVFKRAPSLRGTPYVCLPEIMLRFGLKLRYDPESLQVLLENPKRGNFAQFHTHSPDVKLLFAKGAPSTYAKKRKGVALPEELFIVTSVALSRRPEFVGTQLCVPI